MVMRGRIRKTPIPAPVNYYGKSKLAGENTLRSAGVDYAVVRTNVVYGPGLGRRDFVQWVIEALDDKREITVVTDQYGNPTYVDDLAEAMMKIIERRKTGTYHVGGADYVSRFEFAQKIAEFFMVDPKLHQADHYRRVEPGCPTSTQSRTHHPQG